MKNYFHSSNGHVINCFKPKFEAKFVSNYQHVENAFEKLFKFKNNILNFSINFVAQISKIDLLHKVLNL